MDDVYEVDAHCHVDLMGDWRSIIARLEASKRYTLAVTTTPLAWREEQREAGNMEFVRICAGLHPQLVGARKSELSLLEQAIRSTRFIGEIGLDGSVAHRGTMSDQIHVLQRALNVAAEVGNRVISLHSLRAVEPLLDLVESTGVNRNCTWILHWFTGTTRQLKRALEMGALISVNADMLSTSKGRSHAITAGPTRVLTESDAPFTRRHPHVSGIPSMNGLVGGLADCWGLQSEDAASRIAALARANWFD